MTLTKVLIGHRRVFIGMAMIIFAYLVLPDGLGLLRRGLIAWDIGVVGFLLMTLHLFLTRDSNQMPALAEAQEEGQWAIFWISLLAGAASFFAVTSELSGLKDLPGQSRAISVVFVSATLLLSWVLAHVAFALRYAHEWYDTDANSRLRRGLDFPGDTHPDYMDFLYFAMVLGMTFQVSDVQITARRPRRLALLHGFVSFLYNTIIVALTVNIAAGML